MTIIGGIPSWLQMYFEKIVKKTNKQISEVFPNFNLLIYGGAISVHIRKVRFFNQEGKSTV